MKGIDYLREKLKDVSVRCEKRYNFYAMKDREIKRSITIPIQLRNIFTSTLGWCTRSVDCLADRLNFLEFDNDLFEINEIFKLNNRDVFFDSSILNALICSCSFVYISKDKEGYPRLQVIEAVNATGVIDPITNMLSEGYAVLERNDKNEPILEAYFIPGETLYFENGKYSYSFKNKAPFPLLVPIIHRPDAKRPFGRSRISRACMYYQEYAKRTLERADITAEFYSFPQKYIVGLSQDAEPMETIKATVSSMLQFTKDEDGQSPHLGQFTTPSMSPFTEALRTCASGFAGETGLTLDDLGFVSDNPSSSEAIKASHETLRLYARKAQKTFGSGFLNVGYLACCLRDDFPYRREQIYETVPKWSPVFEPDASTLSLVGDGAIKINQAVQGFINGDVLRDLTGIQGAEERKSIEIKENEEDTEENI